MIKLQLAYDMWCPPSSEVPAAAHYAAMLDQCEYADRNGFELVHFNEHHGTAENYLPAPLVAAAAVAGRTRRLRLRTVLLTPLYDPVRLAESIAVVDLVSGGRAIPVFAAGYRPEEFDTFGVKLADRRRLVDSTVEFVRRAWSGEPVELEGRTVRVTPRPAQRPHPPIVMGGSTKAATRAAARLADDFLTGDPELWNRYREARIEVGKEDPGPAYTWAPFIHVTEDPERDWPRVAPYLLAAIGAYRGWMPESAQSAGSPFGIRDERELRESAGYQLLTPEQSVELIAGLGADTIMNLQPGWGGYHPDLAWSSLELFIEQVLPALPATLLSAT